MPRLALRLQGYRVESPNAPSEAYHPPPMDRRTVDSQPPAHNRTAPSLPPWETSAYPPIWTISGVLDEAPSWSVRPSSDSCALPPSGSKRAATLPTVEGANR